MKNFLEYKGYHTKVEFNSETMTLRGKIEGINDYIDFECEDIKNVEQEFHSAVDDYLEFCKEVGKAPEKEYKGSFNIRISPDLHKKLALCALREECSLNAAVEKAITLYVNTDHFQTKALAESVRDLTEIIKMDTASYANETTVYGSNVIPFPAFKHIYRFEEKM